MSDRAAHIARFLAAHGFGDAERDELPADASFRRYTRLRGGPAPALLMDAPPPEDLSPFIRLAYHLGAAGLTVPKILGADQEAGLLIVGDLGTVMLSDGLVDRPDLLPRAARELARLHRVVPPRDLPRWGPGEMLAATIEPLFGWWWPAAFGGQASTTARREIEVALSAMLAPLARGPVCLAHRDYFVGNMLLTDDDRIGIIAFQSAALGHPAYDLLSLVEDARRTIPTDVASAAIEAYVAARAELEMTDLRAAFAICSAQRHLRVACQWVRLALRDHRPRYLAYGPRTWALLARALARPEAAPLAAALDRHVPPEMRCNPVSLMCAA